LLLVSYVLWMGGSLGLLRNSTGGALFSIVVVAIVSFIVYRRGLATDRQGAPDKEQGLLEWLRAHGRLVLAVELLFAGALALWALVRAYSPELTTAGGEKFMELMYLNSIGRSEYFPPHDAWLSGYAISYYYFGYVMIATLTRLSGFPAHLTFNVGVALLFALTCTGAFGLVYSLVKGADREGSSVGRPIGFGLLGAVLVAVMGNLEGFLEVLYSLRALPMGFWQWLDIKDINQPFDPVAGASLVPGRSGWWWWRASRVIHDLDPQGNSMGIQPIDEFPGFSFLLGDMHPHVLALPFVLLVLAIALRALLWKPQEAEAGDDTDAWWAPVKQMSFLVPLCLGALGFLNTWDFPIYWLVFVAAYGLRRWARFRRFSWPFLRDVGLTGAMTAVLGGLLYLPFYVGFQSQAGGLLPTLYVGTRFRHYFVVFGPFLVAIAGLLSLLALRLKRRAPGAKLLRGWAAWTAAFILAPLGFMLLIVLIMLLLPQGREFLESVRYIPAVYEIVGEDPWPVVQGRLLLVKLRTWVMPLVVAAMAALGAVLLKHSLPSQGERGDHREEKDSGILSHPNLCFALLCAVAGLLLTLSVEFIYLNDNFRVRMNTIFKFYFQGWVLMGIASAFALFWLSTIWPRGRPQRNWPGRAFQVGFWVLFAMGMVYPVLGNYSRAGGFDHAPTLDGTAYLAESHPDDYAATSWLNEHVRGTPVILETPGSGGSSYVYEGRVSTLTGLPTLLGWAGHEGQWRGSYTVQHARTPDIETIYNTRDPTAALTLLEEYDIRYVYVGPLERSKHNAQGLKKFDKFMTIVYQNDRVTIYQIGE
jgi:YYY domain-containing protein